MLGPTIYGPVVLGPTLLSPRRARVVLLSWVRTSHAPVSYTPMCVPLPHRRQSVKTAACNMFSSPGKLPALMLHTIPYSVVVAIVCRLVTAPMLRFTGP